MIDRGYFKVFIGRDHPMAEETGYCYEHRLVAARREGRVLTTDDHVHHINGDRQDNRPENLEVLTHREHMRKMSKLTIGDVRLIRAALSEGQSRKSLAEEYKVSATAIWLIANDRSWPDLEREESVPSPLSC